MRRERGWWQGDGGAAKASMPVLGVAVLHFMPLLVLKEKEVEKELLIAIVIL